MVKGSVVRPARHSASRNLAREKKKGGDSYTMETRRRHRKKTVNGQRRGAGVMIRKKGAVDKGGGFRGVGAL